MVHIVNGQVVDKKPFSLIGLLYAILNFFHLFIATLLPGSTTINDRVERFNDAGRPGSSGGGGRLGGGRPGSNVRGVDHRKAAVGGACGGGG